MSTDRPVRPARRPRTPGRVAGRRARWGLSITVLGLLAVAVRALMDASTGPVPSAPLVGLARVVDGDGLKIGGEIIRLFGIDAPEFDQTCRRGGRDYRCGQEATNRLATLIAGRTVTCTAQRRDRYGRLLATCTAAGSDLGQRMVEAGWAVSYEGRYSTAEAAAQKARTGLWAGEFERPRTFRRERGDALGWWSWWPW